MDSGHSPKIGTKSGYSLADEALSALRAGDTQALINFHKARFGGYFMEDDGGDGDGDDDDAGNKDGDSGDSGSGDDNDDDDDGDSGSGDDVVTKAEFEKVMNRLKAADQRASKAENDLKKINDAKKDDLTKATDRVAELEDSTKTLQADLTDARMQIAFLSTNKHTWHKPSAALKLAQSEGYLDGVVDDDGAVDNKKMSSALDKLAKENAYLVKTGGSGASGEPGGGRSGNGKDDKAQKDADARRAPALSRRGR